MDKTEQIVEMYLSNETKLYQDWYKQINQIEDDSDLVLFASLPSHEGIKKRFKKWFDENREFLREEICIKWEYPRRRSKFQKTQQIIIAVLVDCLAVSLSIPTTNAVTIVTILFVGGYLDDLCASSFEE